MPYVAVIGYSILWLFWPMCDKFDPGEAQTNHNCRSYKILVIILLANYLPFQCYTVTPELFLHIVTLTVHTLRKNALRKETALYFHQPIAN